MAAWNFPLHRQWNVNETRDSLINKRLTCRSSTQAPASVASPPEQQLCTTADVCFFSQHPVRGEQQFVQTHGLNDHHWFLQGIQVQVVDSWHSQYNFISKVVFVKLSVWWWRWNGMQGMQVAAGAAFAPPYATECAMTLDGIF